MRINRLITLGRLEIYIGRQPHWRPQWDAWPTRHGYELRAGHWHFIGEWGPPRKSPAQALEEFLALARKANEARARTAWPARCVP